MLAEKRFDNILRLLRERGSVSVGELCEKLGASESTIRRDLVELHSQGRLTKVHGGATLLSGGLVTKEEPMLAKQDIAPEQKRSVGQYAATLIHAEDFVYIDAGSSTLSLADSVTGEALKAAYVTNGIAHARILAQKGCRVYLPAGRVRPSTEAIVGATTLHSLQGYNFTKAFMGANGVSLTAGFTTPDAEEAELKATVLSRSAEQWFLVDDSKFGQVYAAVICPLAGASIVTNRLPDPRYAAHVLVKETELL